VKDVKTKKKVIETWRIKKSGTDSSLGKRHAYKKRENDTVGGLGFKGGTSQTNKCNTQNEPEFKKGGKRKSLTIMSKCVMRGTWGKRKVKKARPSGR